MSQVAAFFNVKREEIKYRHGLIAAVLLFLPLAVLYAMGLAEYWLSFSFALLYTAMSDPGGPYRVRARLLGLAVIAGTLLTVVGLVLGGGSWIWVTAVLFVVTLLSGFAAAYGRAAATAAGLVDVWFIFALVLPADLNEGAAWAVPQAVAYFAGGVTWIAVMGLVELRRRQRNPQPTHIEPVPEKQPVKLSRPLVLFSLLRAIAVSFAAALAWGFNLPEADWMPISALIIMKPGLHDSVYHGLQRAVGTIFGAALGALVLVFAPGLLFLALAIVVLGSICMAFYKANYTYYAFCMTAGLVIGESLSDPTSLIVAEERVLFVLMGITIGLVVLLIADLATKRNSRAAQQSV